MGIFSPSDLIISITLLVNAMALLSSKLVDTNGNQNAHISSPQQPSSKKPQLSTFQPGHHAQQKHPQQDIRDSRAGEEQELLSSVEDEELLSSTNSSTADASAATGSQPTSVSATTTAMAKFFTIQNAIRRLSGIIVIWNIFFVILMVFVFGS